MGFFLSRLFKRFSRSGADRPASPPPAKAAQSAGYAPSPRFQTAIEELRNRPDGGIGLLRVVSLTDFRQTVGDKWPRLADKVGMIVDNLIRRRIGPGNLHHQMDSETWLLAFMQGNSDNARTLTAAIAQDVSRHLLGDRCVAGERPLASAAHLDPFTALTEGGNLDVAAVRRAAAESRALFAHLTPCAPAAIPMHRFESDMVGKRRKLENTAWTPIIMENKNQPVLEPWVDVGPLPADARLALVWRPTWVAEGEAISAYCARVVRVDHDDSQPLEGPMAYPAEDAVAAFKIDRFVASAAARDLRNGQNQGGSVIIPLTWSTLTGENKNDIAYCFADLEQSVRSSKVQIEIFRIPDDAEPAQVNQACAFVRQLCGGALLRLRLSSTLLCRADQLHDARIGLDLSELRPHERMADDRLLDVLDRLQASGEHAGLGCYVWSARRRRLVGGVVKGGFDMVNGPGLMKDVGRPSVVMPAPRDRLVQG